MISDTGTRREGARRQGHTGWCSRAGWTIILRAVGSQGRAGSRVVEESGLPFWLQEEGPIGRECLEREPRGLLRLQPGQAREHPRSRGHLPLHHPLPVPAFDSQPAHLPRPRPPGIIKALAQG